ncbi:MAG TPA: NAD(P)H-dependent oxidoreductase, partial [Candidatus Eisenbacteria bacterium]|nr:NAD(P)H-dependent oxidoreductase [Candidatus Eisenbacteria bacterium]
MSNLMVVIASTRPGRVGLPVGQWVHRRAVEHPAFDVDLVDLADLGLPFLDEPFESVYIPFVTQFPDEERRFRPNETTEAAITAMLDELERWVGALRTLAGQL